MSAEFSSDLEIPTGWEVKKLVDCTSDQIISYGIVQPGQHVDNGIPIIRVNNVKGGNLALNDVLRVSPEIEGKFSRTRLKGGEVLLTLVGSTGQSFVAPKSLAGWNVPRAIAVIRVADEIGANWVNICLQTKESKQFLDVRANTTVQKTLNIKDVKEIPILIPPKLIKARIEKYSSDLTKKIQLNRQINQTLEAMAQAIFQSWFVDFDPVKAKITAREQWQTLIDGERSEWLNDILSKQAYLKTCLSELTANGEQSASETLYLNIAAMTAISSRDETSLADMPAAEFSQLYKTASLFPERLVDSELGEIPEGWSVGTLGGLIEFNPRRTLKKGTVAPYLDMKNVPTSGHLVDEVFDRELGSGTKFINGDTLLARITPCLENGKTAFVDFLEDNQVGWGSTEYIVMRPKANYPVSLGYFIARNEEFRQHAVQSMTGTSGRQRANSKALEGLDWLAYPIELLLEFDKLSGHYLKVARTNGDQNKSLSMIRDSLLPKLLSGELDVSTLTELTDIEPVAMDV